MDKEISSTIEQSIQKEWVTTQEWKEMREVMSGLETVGSPDQGTDRIIAVIGTFSSIRILIREKNTILGKTLQWTAVKKKVKLVINTLQPWAKRVVTNQL